jgi:hypothetical protein
MLARPEPRLIVGALGRKSLREFEFTTTHLPD